MAPAKALAQLALQKRFLQAESEALRLVLASEMLRVSKPVRWADRFRTRVRPLLTVGAPLAGFWFAHRSRGVKRWVTMGYGVLRLVRKFRRFIHTPGTH